MKDALAKRYRETVDFMFSRLPMYHRIGVQAYKKDVRNIQRLLDFLGNPHQHYPCIHVGGTNGKGSTSHMLSAILQAKGLKTGLFVSPHYRDYRERIKLNGALVDKAFVVDFVERIHPMIEEVQPSFFEITAAMAFDYFSRQQADAAVIEVGLGGRLDSTNIITPVLSVITNISYDHMHLLGNTLPEIAGEKAGIIKQEVPVVIGETHPESAPVFRAKAAEMHAPVLFADAHFEARLLEENFNHSVFDIYQDGRLRFARLDLNLSGDFQRLNVQTVLQAADLLREIFGIEDTHIRQGLSGLKHLTRMIGRWDLISENPRVLADSAHNEGGLHIAMEQIKKMSYRQLHMVIGVVQDKDIQSVLRILPQTARYYFAKAGVPRALDARILKEQAAAAGLKGRAYSSVKNALRAARRHAGPDDLIFIGGSIFVVAEVI